MFLDDDAASSFPAISQTAPTAPPVLVAQHEPYPSLGEDDLQYVSGSGKEIQANKRVERPLSAGQKASARKKIRRKVLLIPLGETRQNESAGRGVYPELNAPQVGFRNWNGGLAEAKLERLVVLPSDEKSENFVALGPRIC